MPPVQLIFNPMADRLRVIGSDGTNLRVNSCRPSRLPARSRLKVYWRK